MKLKKSLSCFHFRSALFLVMLFVLPLILSANSTAETNKVQQNSNKRTITGKVTYASDNEPVIGASVWLKNSSTGVVTNVDGKYAITIEGVGGVLVFSYVGMQNIEIAIGNQNSIDISLKEDSEELDEIVVVGYGHQKKASVVGAISTVNVERLNHKGSSTISNALAGQLSGIVAMGRTGEPGKDSSADFYIRGISSFKGDSKPLVLVDGIERDLDLVDVDDIATFSVLKDASASAVYGVRGANGVIIITTKKGTIGKPVIQVRADVGITSPTRMPKMVNSMQWAELYNEALGREYYSQSEIDKYRMGADPDLYPNVNWIDELYRDQAFNQNIKVNLTGGGDVATYFISGGFYNESSIYKKTADVYDYNTSINYNKFNFRANMDFELSPSTKLNLNLSNIYEKSNGPGASRDNIWGYSFNTSPNAFPKEYSDGTLSAPSTSSGYNPWNLLVHSGYHEQWWNSAQSLMGITQDIGKLWEPLDGLSANAKFSWDAWSRSLQGRLKEPTQYHAKGRDEDGNLIFGSPIYTGDKELKYTRGNEATMTTYLEASLTYSRLFNSIHRVGGLFLYNHKNHRKLEDPDRYKSLPYKNQGIAARVTYALFDRYFAEVNMGYNGSENFARGKRFGFFPAVSAGWLVSEESWFAPIKDKVNLLKLKGSYGKVGNDDIGGQRRWVYESTIVSTDGWNYGKSGNSNFGGDGIRIGEVENLNASWEEAKKINLGVEFSFFNKLKVMGDWFKENRTGIYLQRASLPNIVGLSTIPYLNVGETQNQGYELTVEFEQKVGEIFLGARGNFSYNRNKVVNNDEPDWQYKYQNKIGKPFGKDGQYQPMGLVALGLFESQEEIDNSPVQSFGEYRVGDVKYQDINGDGVIDSYDRIAIGYTNLPEITYGFGLNANGYGFDINLFFQGVARTSFMVGGTPIDPFSSGNLSRAAINADIYDKAWKTTNTAEQNANALYPRLSYETNSSGASNNRQASTMRLRDGSFMRLKNVELGYTLSRSTLSKTFFKDLRFYVSANNLLTFSKFKLWDPETGTGNGAKYPPNKVITIGFSTKF